MKKAIIGTLLGTAVYFGWIAVSWTVFPWHKATIKTLPNEALIVDTLKVVVKEPGLYGFPANTGDNATWAEKIRQGPVGHMAYVPAGADPMSAMVMVRGFVCDLLLSALLMWILWASRLRKRVHQIHLAAAVGLIAGLAVGLPLWNWMSFPAGYTAVTVLDLLIGFILMGAVMGGFVPDASRE